MMRSTHFCPSTFSAAVAAHSARWAASRRAARERTGVGDVGTRPASIRTRTLAPSRSALNHDAAGSSSTRPAFDALECGTHSAMAHPSAPRVEHAADHDLRLAPLPWGPRPATARRRDQRPRAPVRGQCGAGRRVVDGGRRSNGRAAGTERSRQDNTPATAGDRHPPVVRHGASRRAGSRPRRRPRPGAGRLPVTRDRTV